MGIQEEAGLCHSMHQQLYNSHSHLHKTCAITIYTNSRLLTSSNIYYMLIHNGDFKKNLLLFVNNDMIISI